MAGLRDRLLRRTHDRALTTAGIKKIGKEKRFGENSGENSSGYRMRGISADASHVLNGGQGIRTLAP